MRLVALFVYIRVYVYLYYVIKNRVFSALPLENLLLSEICCLIFEFKQCLTAQKSPAK